jgi:hypothetical protein
LFFNPLFALRMLFRECVTLCFGTAHSSGGNSSASESSSGMAGRYHGEASAAEYATAASAGASAEGAVDALRVDFDEDGVQGKDQDGRAAATRAEKPGRARRGAVMAGVMAAMAGACTGGSDEVEYSN